MNSQGSTERFTYRPGLSTAEQQRLLEQSENLKAEEETSIEMMEMSNQMFLMIPEFQQLQYFDERIPSPLFDCRKDFINIKWPIGVDCNVAKEFIERAFLEAQCLPYSTELDFLQNKIQPSNTTIVKRLNALDYQKINWYFSGNKKGAIYKNDLVGNECFYPPIIRHNFSNLPIRKGIITAGTTHVAIGFVDLNFLLFVQIINVGIKPVRFVGYERSAFCVAKTIVIWDILQTYGEDEDLINRSVLQIWYSSTWEQETLNIFKSAVTRLVSRKGFDRLYDEEVRRILLHWKNTNGPDSLSEVRKQWLKRNQGDKTLIPRMLLREDRIAMAKYELTGDFGLLGEPYCASITMFDCPDGIPPCARSETIFSLVDYETLIQNENATFIETAEKDILSRIKRLRYWATEGIVTVELHYNSVEDVVKEIAALRPSTMSWSNVIDYFNAKTFHGIARACSIHGNTIHFGYSMNWMQSMIGTYVYDYAVEARKEIFKGARNMQRTYYNSFGKDPRIRVPLPECPVNTTMEFLCLDYYKTWSKYWINEARVSGPVKLGTVEPSLCWGYSGCFIANMTWTYDPNVAFHSNEQEGIKISNSSTKSSDIPSSSSSSSSSSRPPTSPSPSLSTSDTTNIHCAKCYKKESKTMKLSICSGCHDVHYCSRECQRLDWPVHKKLCKRMQK
jgi:hypothetical protein